MIIRNFMSLNTKGFSTLFLLIFLFLTFSIQANPGDKKQPRLILRVVVEQMRYEMLVRYWDEFDENGGFKRLVDKGMLCTNASLNYAVTQRSSGFATLASGADPSGHGIISDYWYNRLSDKNISSVEDNNYKITGVKKGDPDPGYSPLQIFSSTLGDELKLLNQKSKVYSLALNPVSSVLGNGRISDGAFWFDDKDGYWVTSSYYMDSLPQWVDAFNQKGLQKIYMSRYWEKLMPDSNYTSSMPDENDAEEGFLILYKKNFPYNLETLKNKSRSYKYLKYTPFGNTYTKDFAMALLANEQLGRDNHADLLNLSFSASSYVNDIFGPRSVEMEDLYIRLDKLLGHLLDYVDEHIGRENALVVLTSDRGCADPYEFRKEHKLPAKRFNPRQGITLLNSYLNIIYEEGNWIKAYANRQLYLNHGLIDQKGYDIEKFQEQIARFMVKKSGVLYAVKSLALNNNHFASGVFSEMQNSYHPKRSGDVLLVLQPGTAEYPESTGSVYSYDNHIPVLWYGMGLKKGVTHEHVRLKDITPTICTLLNIPFPDAANGEAVKSILNSFENK